MPTGNFYYVTIHYNSLTLARLIGLQDWKVKAEGGGRFRSSVVVIYLACVCEAPSPFPALTPQNVKGNLVSLMHQK